MPVFLEKEDDLRKRLSVTNNPYEETGGIIYYKCPVCLKMFSTYHGYKWVYRMTHNKAYLMFCGYKCLSDARNIFEAEDKAEKEAREKAKQEKRAQKKLEKEKSMLINDGNTITT